MAKKKQKPNKGTSSLLYPIPTIPKGKTLVLDVEEIPVQGIYGRSVDMTYPDEFRLIDSMNVNQSVVFKLDKKAMVNAIRTRIHKISIKRFVMKKINAEYCRLWRLKDGAKINSGGRVAGVSPYKKEKNKSWSRIPKDKQNPDGTLKKGSWGGARTKGQKINSTESKIESNN